MKLYDDLRQFIEDTISGEGKKDNRSLLIGDPKKMIGDVISSRDKNNIEDEMYANCIPVDTLKFVNDAARKRHGVKILVTKDQIHDIRRFLGQKDSMNVRDKIKSIINYAKSCLSLDLRDMIPYTLAMTRQCLAIDDVDSIRRSSTAKNPIMKGVFDQVRKNGMMQYLRGISASNAPIVGLIDKLRESNIPEEELVKLGDFLAISTGAVAIDNIIKCSSMYFTASDKDNAEYIDLEEMFPDKLERDGYMMIFDNEFDSEKTIMATNLGFLMTNFQEDQTEILKEFNDMVSNFIIDKFKGKTLEQLDGKTERNSDK